MLICPVKSLTVSHYLHVSSMIVYCRDRIGMGLIYNKTDGYLSSIIIKMKIIAIASNVEILERLRT